MPFSLLLGPPSPLISFMKTVLLQAGKLSQEEADVIAEKLGLKSVPPIERTASLSKTTQLYNFSVLKWSKGGSVQRLILQVCVYSTK